jgi:hypothetical protein
MEGVGGFLGPWRGIHCEYASQPECTTSHHAPHWCCDHSNRDGTRCFVGIRACLPCRTPHRRHLGSHPQRSGVDTPNSHGEDEKEGRAQRDYRCHRYRWWRHYPQCTRQRRWICLRLLDTNRRRYLQSHRLRCFRSTRHCIGSRRCCTHNHHSLRSRQCAARSGSPNFRGGGHAQ